MKFFEALECVKRGQIVKSSEDKFYKQNKQGELVCAYDLEVNDMCYASPDLFSDEIAGCWEVVNLPHSTSLCTITASQVDNDFEKRLSKLEQEVKFLNSLSIKY
jgi:hypothetical protein